MLNRAEPGHRWLTSHSRASSVRFWIVCALVWKWRLETSYRVTTTYVPIGYIANNRWDEDEAPRLIEIWGDDHIHEHLECCKHKSVYKKIARCVEYSVYGRSLDKCREKVKKLKDTRQRAETLSPEIWKYFVALDSILGDKPSMQPLVVANFLAISEETNKND